MKDGIQKRIGTDLEKQNVGVFATATMTGIARARRRGHRAKVNYMHAGAYEPVCNLSHVTIEPDLQAANWLQ